MVQPGPAAGAVEDLIHPRRRQRLTAARSLQHHEHPIGPQPGRTLSVQICGDRIEKPRRDRDQPLMTTLAIGDEHPPLRDPQILHPQAQHLTPAQPTQHHRRDHRPIPMTTQSPAQRVHILRRQDQRQRPARAHQRHTLARTHPLPASRQTPRHRIGGHVTAGEQIREQPRHARQPPPQRPRRHPTRTGRRDLHSGRRTTGALGGHERKHVRRLHVRHRLGHNREEHLQVIRRRQHRVRPTPPGKELQILIQQWVEPAPRQQRHCGHLHPILTPPQRRC